MNYKLFFLILGGLLITPSGQSQHARKTNTKYTVDQVMDSLQDKGLRRGVDIKSLRRRFVTKINVVKSLPRQNADERILGKVVPVKGSLKSTVFIVEDVLDDFYAAERVVAHELGHSFYLNHCCVDKYCPNVMAGTQSINPETILYQIAFEFRYEETMDVYFSEIKERLRL
jgi:hypothetical protein